jgi:nicotinamide-nucleotide amidase
VSTLRAEIITIGHEVLSGHTLNTNAAEMAQMLDEIGVDVQWVTTCGDVEEHMTQAYTTAWNRADVIISTGGLGPTHDDITRGVFCRMFDRELVMHEEMLANITNLFGRRGRTLTDRNRDQALVPERTQALVNRWGTAPGVYMNEDGRHFFLLPGVPREMRGLMKHEIVPILSELNGMNAIVRRQLHVVGWPESHLMDRIQDIPGLEAVASLPDLRGEVNLRITVARPTHEESNEEVARLESALRERLGTSIYGVDDETLESVVGTLLTDRGWTIATAESCTGGLVSSRITDIPGSSGYFTMGVVAYSNEAKERILGVPAELIREHGAVSEEVARAMAEGVRKVAGTDVGVALTGIMGPDGGTDEKPVGLAWVAVADASGTVTGQINTAWDRVANKRRTSQHALDMVRMRLLGE